MVDLHILVLGTHHCTNKIYNKNITKYSCKELHKKDVHKYHYKQNLE